MLAKFASRFIQRQQIWWPTPLGWVSGVLVAGLLALSWTFLAEPWLSLTDRRPAKILVVEGWIGLEGVKATAQEFSRGDYDLVVTAGGLTGERWNVERWNYAEMAAKELSRLGVPQERILTARAHEVESQRTFEAAAAAWRALHAKGIEPTAINLFTRGPHARRSRLVYTKVFGRETEVGVISWTPASEAGHPWWNSSDRATDLLKESIGYPLELLLNSGRPSNSAIPDRTK
jgi:hypothetical protein